MKVPIQKSDKFPFIKLEVENRLEKKITIEGKVFWLVFLKTCRAIGSGNIGLIKEFLYESVAAVAVLKIFSIERFWWIAMILAFLYESGNVIIGYLCFRKNFVERENVLSAHFNPVLMETLENTRKNEENN